MRPRARLHQQSADLFAPRHLFVPHDVTPAARRTLPHLPPGVPQVRTLRASREGVYRLLDPRCPTDPAWATLAKRRPRVRRCTHGGKIFSKRQSPNLEKALPCLEDKLLPSPSTAVARGHRRHRKMQKTVARVRTQDPISNRIALALLRASQQAGRTDTLQILHRKRAA